MEIITKETKRGVEFTTPKGRSGFSALTVPSTKFKEEGEYSIALLLPANAPETDALIAILDTMLIVSEKKALAETKKKKVKVADPPYKAEEDADGEETGNIKFNFKLPAKFSIKDDQGNIVDTIYNKPVLFDARGHKLPSSVRIGGGSLVRVSAEAAPYYTDGFGAGVKLRLRAVQVIELVEQGSGVSFAGAGFDIEDGYDASDDDGETAQSAGSVTTDETDF